MSSPPPARPGAARRRATRRPAPRAAGSASARRRGAAARAGARARRARRSPAGTNGTGEISTTARSKPRARRSSSARTDALVEQRRERQHERVRRQRAHRKQVDVLPRVAQEDLGVEQRVEDAVELDEPARGGQPVQHAAEGDEADAVLLAHVVGRERRRGVAPRGRACSRRAPRASAKVSRKMTTSVFRSGWVSFTQGSPRRAVARQLTRRTRSPGTNGRRSANSIPSPRVRGSWLPAKGCVSSGRSSCSQHLAARVDLQREPPLEGLLEDEQPEGIVRAEDEVADEVGAPALAAETVARARAARPA